MGIRVEADFAYQSAEPRLSAQAVPNRVDVEEDQPVLARPAGGLEVVERVLGIALAQVDGRQMVVRNVFVFSSGLEGA
jgi:hypothetical protein